MSSMDELTQLPHSFDGVVRLFPLPNLVMFPKVVQPLHIFEPRYCDLLEDALATDQLITMALLQSGWEAGYEGRPSVEPIVCIGKIISHSRLPEGKHNLLLLGLQRARVIYELPVSAAFRKARVELIESELAPLQATARADLQSRLVDLFKRYLPDNEQVREQFDQLLTMPIDLGMLTDVIAFTVNLEIVLKQRLLAEPGVEERASLLITELTARAQNGRDPRSLFTNEFPPRFSDN